MSKVKLRHFLTIAIGIIVAWVFISRVIVPWFYKPRDTAKLKIQNLQSKVLKLRQLEAVSKNDEYYLAATSRNSFSMDESEAISQMGIHLTEAIKTSGLSEDQFTRRPIKTTQLTKNGAKQIGYTVSGQGPLPRIIDLLYLLEQNPSFPAVNITSYARRENSLLVRTQVPHLFQKDQLVEIRGAFPINRKFPSSYNGTFRVIKIGTNSQPTSLTLALPRTGNKTSSATNYAALNSTNTDKHDKRNWLSRLLFMGNSKKQSKSEANKSAIIRETKQVGNQITIATKGNHPFKADSEIRLFNLIPSSMNKTVRIKSDSPARFSFVLDDGKDAHTSAIISALIPQRVHSITMLPVDTSEEVKIDFQFLSLVTGPTKLAKESQLKTRKIEAKALVEENRSLFAAITKRAFFLPYQKKPAPPPAPPPTTKPEAPAAPPPPGPETYKIVSLSEWQGQHEIMVFDTNQNKTANYKPGDTLAGGKIVMIDYRKMPFPKKPALLSQSRVILSIGEEYWAIERGNTLADIHRLESDQLPTNLAK